MPADDKRHVNSSLVYFVCPSNVIEVRKENNNNNRLSKLKQ